MPAPLPPNPPRAAELVLAEAEDTAAPLLTLAGARLATVPAWLTATPLGFEAVAVHPARVAPAFMPWLRLGLLLVVELAELVEPPLSQ